MTEAINLAQKLALFSDHWRPRTVGRLNALDIMARPAVAAATSRTMTKVSLFTMSL